MPLEIARLTVGPLGTNCYLAWDDGSREGVVVDPGYEPERVSKRIKAEGIRAKAVLLTHGHFDHVTEALALADELGIPAYMNPLDLDLFSFGRSPEAIGEGFALAVGPTEFRAIHTPGHTRGSLVFYGTGHLFSGDLLFAGGIGRTDLPGGSYREIMLSLRNKVLSLPPETVVYPGHGPSTTIGDEASTY